MTEKQFRQLAVAPGLYRWCGVNFRVTRGPNGLIVERVEA